MSSNLSTNLPTYLISNIYTDTYTHIYVYISTYLYRYVHIYLISVCVYMCIYTSVCMQLCVYLSLCNRESSLTNDATDPGKSPEGRMERWKRRGPKARVPLRNTGFQWPCRGGTHNGNGEGTIREEGNPQRPREGVETDAECFRDISQVEKTVKHTGCGGMEATWGFSESCFTCDQKPNQRGWGARGEEMRYPWAQTSFSKSAHEEKESL